MPTISNRLTRNNMARSIRSTDEAAGPIPEPTIPEGGVLFANNLPNRFFTFGPNNSLKFKFSGTRAIIEDPVLVARLDEIAKTDRTVFRVEMPVLAPMQPPAPPLLTGEALTFDAENFPPPTTK